MEMRGFAEPVEDFLPMLSMLVPIQDAVFCAIDLTLEIADVPHMVQKLADRRVRALGDRGVGNVSGRGQDKPQSHGPPRSGATSSSDRRQTPADAAGLRHLPCPPSRECPRRRNAG